MRNESGMSIVTLVILTVVIMIVAFVIINYAQKMKEETDLQDLRTNMFFIQAEAKKGAEEVCFGTVNLDETKEEDLAKINQVKQENLAGVIFSTAPTEVQESVKNIAGITFDDSCYYLDETILTEMGIKEVNSNQYGYYIVKYDFETAGVEVINTKGHNGIYTLTELNQLIEANPIEEGEKNTEGEPVS